MQADKSNLNDKELKKFFRAFELSTEYRERLYNGHSIFHKPSQLIRGYAEYQFLSYYFAQVPKWRLRLRSLRSKARAAPNYVVVGPMKNASSDLVSHLQMHPNVMHPLAKEIPFYSAEQVKLYYPTLKEIQRLEEKTNSSVRCGFLRPDLNSMHLIGQLHDLNPDSKIIITLRDPVSRAYSHWKWEVFLGGKQMEQFPHFASFEQYIDRALDLFPSMSVETACGYQVLETGIYHKSVEHWIKKFGRENVMVLDSAEYFANRQPTLEKVQKFLELPVVDIPEYGDKANENPLKLSPATEQTKSKLAAFYKPYNQQLFDLLGKDFCWQ